MIMLRSSPHVMVRQISINYTKKLIGLFACAEITKLSAILPKNIFKFLLVFPLGRGKFISILMNSAL